MSYGQAESLEKGGTGMEGWTPPAREGSIQLQDQHPGRVGA